MTLWFVACSNNVSYTPGGPSPTPTPADSCKGVPVQPIGPGEEYRLPDAAGDLATKCQILASLEAGAFVVAFGDEAAFVEESLGAANPGVSASASRVDTSGTPDPNASYGPIPSPIPTWSPEIPTPTPRPTPTRGPVIAAPYAVAGFVRLNGILETFEADAYTKSRLESELAAWEADPQADGATPPPANKVWTLIGSNRQVVEGPKQDWGIFHPEIATGTLSLLTDTWRLSTNDRHEDYFMVATVMSTTPNYYQGPGNLCYPVCRYWTWKRHQVVELVPYYGAKGSTEDVGPKNGIHVDKFNFDIGANLGGKIGFGGDKGATGEGNAGISAKYGMSWEQPHAKTIAKSTIGAQRAEWQDDTLNFMSGATYDFAAWRNITTTANFTNGRAAIFRLPRRNPGSPPNPYILPTLTNYFLVRGSSCFSNGPLPCFFTVQAEYQEIHITSTQQFPVWMPTFSVDQTKLSLKPGQEATFRIRLRSSEGESSKAWQVVKDPNDANLHVSPHAGQGSDHEYQTVTVKAQPTARHGSTYTLYVNTVPAGGADSLRYGSLLVRVDIE